MLAMYHNSGFYCAPITKSLLGSLVLTSVAFNVPLQSYRNWFAYDYNTVFEDFDILNFLTCRLVFLDPKDIVCAGILLYHFRIFERRYGSRKFASHLLGSFLLSSLLELAAVYVCYHLDLTLDPMPSGPYGAIFPLFVPYFCDVPRVAVTHVLHIPVTGKSLNYVIGLQMASGSPESLLLALCGIISGVLYRKNFLLIQWVMTVPAFLGRLCDTTLARLVETAAPTDVDLPMGATLEIQRQQQIERLEQQMAWAQFQPAQQHNFGGFGLFGNRNMNAINGNIQLNNILNGNIPAQAAPNANIPPVAPVVTPAEDQVQRLVEMGFTRESVLQALRVTNNDSNLATNILLQES
jgi:membrane associated rhomboid family serine protease